MSRPCIAVLGGSFDPVHNGHVALGGYFARLLFPDTLRLIPAGNPWQKQPLEASAEDRIAMLKLAFRGLPVPVVIDEQEIRRQGATYTIATLKSLRAELGTDAAIAFLIGADQLQRLDTWVEWESLFDLAHICAAARPGFSVDEAHLPQAVRREFARRAGTPQQLRDTPHGLTYLAGNLDIDIAATDIRAALRRGEAPAALIPGAVLDYIKSHHLYQD
ncbi:nicotinate-nucleotide adenylyltransferase [Noviherbaspirillum humi]|uniref:Probable nicotinate-nucleotide adenylyltransferase n=1 Tax=Noviherbaspirillum humi TaxID=1688639 RepID=A0A239EBM6_9BURK|nr:nicotinate-nucleotide adenylyltransferase [Noviherbaspirillum humi]SNS41334.1 nicotinate-nucleotide adenylyltransferase [Noviherbaspirillum humi]